MKTKLTILVTPKFSAALHKKAGPRGLGVFIEQRLSPEILQTDLERGYRDMAKDEAEMRELAEVDSIAGDLPMEEFHEKKR